MADETLNSRRTVLTKAILATLAVGGLLTIAAVAPNAIQLLGPLVMDKRRKANKQFYVKSTLGRLAEQGLVKFTKNTRGQTCVALTTAGKRELQRYEFEKLKIPAPKHWDGKYRVIIFDIHETRRKLRDELRIWLVKLGFVRLQQSVWVYPYECQGVIILLKSHFRIGKDILYLTVDSIENDRWLKQHFNLS